MTYNVLAIRYNSPLHLTLQQPLQSYSSILTLNPWFPLVSWTEAGAHLPL